MHICDLDIGVLGADGIVAGGIPMSVGAAFSSSYRKSGQVVVCFFGDGASNQGSFHESLNLASLWKLPIVFVCENNLYAITTPVAQSLPINDVADRARAYGMAGEVVDGMDVLEVRRAAGPLLEKARSGGGPSLLECKTYRFEGHWFGDPVVYRSDEEVEQWRMKDPITRLRTVMLEKDFSEADLETISATAKDRIEQAVAFAEKSPLPDIRSLEEGVEVALEYET